VNGLAFRGYVVEVADCAGNFCDEHVGDSFGAALEAVKRLAAKYPAKVVVVYNLDRVDVDFDGLTDDERFASWDAVDDAVGVADVAVGNRR
jgi:hypothetical protein